MLQLLDGGPTQEGRNFKFPWQRAIRQVRSSKLIFPKHLCTILGNICADSTCMSHITMQT
ncbi:unnamed protein product [Hymenolepis diminuta]|uniref:Uncharacterized protein n=1 Tax=Hymenolepis diminuta TaxID=6216 RepID=A0A564YS27_HYMDI|nr:unnamed protein product [Hymenolepis diminuta]